MIFFYNYSNIGTLKMEVFYYILLWHIIFFWHLSLLWPFPFQFRLFSFINLNWAFQIKKILYLNIWDIVIVKAHCFVYLAYICWCPLYVRHTLDSLHTLWTHLHGNATFFLTFANTVKWNIHKMFSLGC